MDVCQNNIIIENLSPELKIYTCLLSTTTSKHLCVVVGEQICLDPMDGNFDCAFKGS